MEDNINLNKLIGIVELKKSLTSGDYKKLLDSLSSEELKRLQHLELGLSKEDEFMVLSHKP